MFFGGARGFDTTANPECLTQLLTSTSHHANEDHRFLVSLSIADRLPFRALSEVEAIPLAPRLRVRTRGSDWLGPRRALSAATETKNYGHTVHASLKAHARRPSEAATIHL